MARKKDIEKRNKFKIILFTILISIFIVATYLIFWIFRWQNLASDMMQNTSSVILDIDENVIAELGSEKSRKNISFKEIPDNLKNAYISIEDQRYYSHLGVDIKRTSAAIINYITRTTKSFGGSTITQQLVKNLTGNSSGTISRKVSEWFRAWALELAFSKEEILESYLNIIYVGPNIYGVEAGSLYYFNKSSSELSLVECAFLAGINNAPNSYNPFGENDTSEKIEKRTKIVLDKMNELGYISEEELNTAISDLEKGLKFEKGKFETSNKSNIYSYHTDALLTEVIDDISDKKHISTDFATNYLKMAGLKIYSTQDSTVQKRLETEFENSKYIIKSSNNANVTSQAAMVIINQNNGQVVGCIRRSW